MKHIARKWMAIAMVIALVFGCALAEDNAPTEAASEIDAEALYQEGMDAYDAEDYATTLEKFTPAAEAGYAPAQNMVGHIYDYAEGVEKDYALAAEWYEKAMAQGDVDATTNMAWLYCNGQGVEQDYAKALELFEQAAEQGHAEAQFNLGCMYTNGNGVEQDDVAAMDWFMKAAEQGIDDAQYYVGRMYEDGRGVNADLEQARAWYQRAADNGNAEAAMALAEAGASAPAVVDAQNFTETVVVDGAQCRLTLTSPGTIEGDDLWWGVRLENTGDKPLEYFWHNWETYVNDEMVPVELYDANDESMNGQLIELAPGEAFEGKIELSRYTLVPRGIRDVEEVGLALEDRVENEEGYLDTTDYRGAFVCSPALRAVDDAYAEGVWYWEIPEGMSGETLLDDENCLVKVNGWRNYAGSFDLYATIENRSDVTIDVSLENIRANGISVDPTKYYDPHLDDSLVAGKKNSNAMLSLRLEVLEPVGISEVTDIEGKLCVVSWINPEIGESVQYSVPVELHLEDAASDGAASAGEASDGAASAESAQEPVEITDKEQIKGAQELLNMLGYDCGTPDGIAGKKTKEAIRQFQEDNGLNVTGTIVKEAYDALLGKAQSIRPEN